MKRLHLIPPRTIVLVACAVFAASGFEAPLWSSGPATPAAKITFNRDIAPIVYQYCAACHRPGESAPFRCLRTRTSRNMATRL